MYLRLNVLEQNLQLYGLSPESNYADQLIVCSPIRGVRDHRTLLLVAEEMGFALEVLATLIAGRKAVSLHFATEPLPWLYCRGRAA